MPTPSKSRDAFDEMHQEEGLSTAGTPSSNGIYGFTRKLMNFVVPSPTGKTPMNEMQLEATLANITVSGHEPIPKQPLFAPGQSHQVSPIL